MDDIRTRLRAAGERRTRAVDDLADASKVVNDLIQEALAAGVPLAEAARLAGVSRTAIYKKL